MSEPLLMFTEEERGLIWRNKASGCPDDEFEMFMRMAQRTGLDPLANQVYTVRRGGKWTIQTGIDGYRLIADRTGKYAGSDDAEITPGDKYPAAARVTVWKMLDGQRCPFSATARWDEYFPGEAAGGQWKKMPHVMLSKVAEALALRKAFPADLSGLYTSEEMAQADRQEPQPKVSVARDAAEFMSSLGMTGVARKSFADQFGKGWEDAVLVAKARGVSTVEGLIDMYASVIDSNNADREGEQP